MDLTGVHVLEEALQVAVAHILQDHDRMLAGVLLPIKERYRWHSLKVHKREKFFVSDFEFFTIL